MHPWMSLISLKTFDYFDEASDWWMTYLISNFMILIISFLVVFSLNVLPFYCSSIWLCNEMLMNLI